VCQPCRSNVTTSDDVGDTNPDPQKHRFESAKGRWGENPGDQWTKPANRRRDVVARGMSRFEIEKIAPKQPAWERLSSNVICVLGFNPSAFTLNGTCCYLVGQGKRRILIDAADGNVGHAEFLEALDTCMRENSIEGLQEILITHMHFDHYGGIPGLLERFGKDTPVGKLPNPPNFWATVDIARDQGLVPYLEYDDGTPRWQAQGTPADAIVPPECILPWPDEDAEAGRVLSWDHAQRTKIQFIVDYAFAKRSYRYGQQLEHEWNFHRISHGDVIHTEGATLVAYHTPGHASDHCSFWLQEEKSLFSGDHVLGWGTTFMVDLYDYMKSLEFMIALRPVHLYPGHGPMIADGLGLLERYIVHRKSREDQVEDVLLQHPQPLSSADIVSMIYTDTPEKRLWMARENVSKILRKFEKAGMAKAFTKQPDGTLEGFSFPQNWTLVRRQREDIVWLHRVHVSATEVESASSQHQARL